MTLKIIRRWENEIHCMAFNTLHKIKWTRILAERRLLKAGAPTQAGESDPDPCASGDARLLWKKPASGGKTLVCCGAQPPVWHPAR